MEFFPSSLRILYVYIKLENTANKLGFYGKSLFLKHKYLGETGFAEFACLSPVYIMAVFKLMNYIIITKTL